MLSELANQLSGLAYTDHQLSRLIELAYLINIHEQSC